MKEACLPEQRDLLARRAVVAKRAADVEEKKRGHCRPDDRGSASSRAASIEDVVHPTGPWVHEDRIAQSCDEYSRCEHVENARHHATSFAHARGQVA